MKRWLGGQSGSVVILVTIDGGGHTWPSGYPYLGKWIVGPVCRDFSACEMIWAFFSGVKKRR